MRKQTVKLIYLLMMLVFVSCDKNEDHKDTPEVSNKQLYINAIKDASRTLTESDIYNGLLPISYGESSLIDWRIEGADTLLLVSSYHDDGWLDYFDFEEDDITFTSSPFAEYMIWATIPGQVESYLAKDNLNDSLSVNIRINQIIGVPEDNKGTHYYLFWVNKKDLIRPSYDPNPTTTYGSITFPVGVEQWYRDWFEEYVAWTYEDPEAGKYYPFTRLGYTYDWGMNKSKYGPSEFLVRPMSKLYLEKVISGWQYYLTEVQ